MNDENRMEGDLRELERRRKIGKSMFFPIFRPICTLKLCTLLLIKETDLAFGRIFRSILQDYLFSLPQQVFLFRSWASVRVMTADQRDELLKRVMKDDQSGKLSFKDCGRIAKELNLSLEQVNFILFIIYAIL